VDQGTQSGEHRGQRERSAKWNKSRGPDTDWVICDSPAGIERGATCAPPDQLGFAYMLGGDTGPSGEVGGTCNSSPYATAKDPNCHWVVTGPHVMLFGPPSKALGYPRTADPDPTKPYMMWPNTPYEHAMVPVK
jgi:hypothetical protein